MGLVVFDITRWLMEISLLLREVVSEVVSFVQERVHWQYHSKEVATIPRSSNGFLWRRHHTRRLPLTASAPQPPFSDPPHRTSNHFDTSSQIDFNMSYFLPHLPSGWHVDEAIKSEEDRVVVIRFGHDWDSQCMTMDETLHGVAEKVQNFAVIYLVDITEVPDFNKVRSRHYMITLAELMKNPRQMYELYDPCTVMFFYRYV